MNFRSASIDGGEMTLWGQQLPPRSLVGAAAMLLITDTKANGWRGRDGLPRAMQKNSSLSPGIAIAGTTLRRAILSDTERA